MQKLLRGHLALQLESHNQVNYFAKVSGVITSIQIVSKVTIEHIGTTHPNLQTPPGVRSQFSRGGVRIRETSNSKGIFRSKIGQTRPLAVVATRMHFLVTTIPPAPLGTQRGPPWAEKIPENSRRFLVDGGGETPRRGFWTSLGLVFRVSHTQWWIWVQTKWWKSIP